MISRNIDNADLSVELLCRELGVSRTVLYLRMKKVFGLSPNNLVLDACEEGAGIHGRR